MRSESTVRGRELGRRLLSAQKKAGFNGLALAAKIEWNPSILSRTMTGQRKPSDVEVASILGVCGVTGSEADQILRLCRPHRDTSLHLSLGEQWQIYLTHAGTAVRLVEFQPSIVPWMLQIPDYTRALLADGPGNVASDVDAVVRREALRLLRLPRVEILLSEWVLRTPLQGPKMMSEQLHHLLRISVRGNLSVRVVPIGRGMAAGRHGAFTLLAFADCPPVLYREDHAGGVLSDSKPDITAYGAVCAALDTAALDEGSSRELIGRIAVESYGDDAGQCDRWGQVSA